MSQAILVAMSFVFYASLVGPFAGFLASGVKRAHQIKDFSNTFPGHGGFIDRFDCITLLSGFFYVLLSSGMLYRDHIDLQQADYLLMEVDEVQRL